LGREILALGTIEDQNDSAKAGVE